MEEQPRSFDICILCALYEEASVIIEEFEIRSGATFTKAFRRTNKLEYRHATIQNLRGEELSVFVTWLSDMGPIRTALDIKPLLQETKPRFVAMTGICAGDRNKVKLGDLIVATSAYHPEEGKITVGTNDQPVHLPETREAGATTQVRQYVQSFATWREPVRELNRQKLNATDELHCHIGAMASTLAVRSDNPFPKWTSQHHRKTLGIDTETAAFYTALHDFPLIHGLVAKGVSDYGDNSKTDEYRDYAARSSAVYMLHFIQEYVTEETMPRREAEPPRVFTVRAQRDLFFTGCEALLQSLHQIMMPGNIAAITQAISGMGGIGKTHTAIEYAYRFRQSYQAVLWLSADSWENLLSSCFALATELELPEEKEANRVLTAVQRWLREHRHWLLILDNIEQVQEILPRFVPAGHQGCVLMTTRIHDVEPLARTHVIDLMQEQEGVLFLLRRIKIINPTENLDQATAVQQEEARQIWKILGGLPLALDQAGAYILETGCAFSSYREQFAERRTDLLGRRGRRFVGHDASVAATLSLAIEKIEVRSSLATELLRVCSLLDGEAIPEELFSEGNESLALPQDMSLNEAIGVLRDYSMVQRNREGKSLSIHRLVQAVLQDEMKKADRQRRIERIVLAINRVFPHVDIEATTWPQCERLLPQALVATAYIEQHQLTHLEAGRLLHETAHYFQARGRDQESESLYLRSLSIKEQLLGPEHPDMVCSLNNLAILYAEQEKYAMAEPLFQRALDIREQQLGLEHSQVVVPLSNLAKLHRLQRKYSKAELLYQRALTIFEQQSEQKNPDAAYPLAGLADLYREQEKYPEADLFYRRALSIQEDFLKPSHSDLADTLYGFAALQEAQSNLQEAMLLYQRVLTIRKDIYGSQHPKTIDTRERLRAVLVALGRTKEAERLDVAQPEETNGTEG
jgi:nucleoside phosphorylase/tetratricopeptide (TPR) repeat protein